MPFRYPRSVTKIPLSYFPLFTFRLGDLNSRLTRIQLNPRLIGVRFFRSRHTEYSARNCGKAESHGSLPGSWKWISRTNFAKFRALPQAEIVLLNINTLNTDNIKYFRQLKSDAP